MEFMNYYAKISDHSGSDMNFKTEDDRDAKFIEDETNINQNSSDYYGLTNINRLFSDPENEMFSEDYIERYEN